MNEGMVIYTPQGHRKVRTCTLSPREQLNITRKLGEVYQSKTEDMISRVEEMRPGYEDEDTVSFIRRINRGVDSCIPESQLILKKDFFGKSEEKWYLAYMSEKHYYAARRRAVQEFLSCLNLWTVVK